MQFYDYDEFLVDIQKLIQEVKASYNPDAIVCIARGGMTIGHFMSIGLKLRELYAMNSIHYEEENKLDYIKIFNIPNLSEAKRVLIVDDIIDSGETMIEIKKTLQEKYPNSEYKVATLFYKEKSLMQPEFSAKVAYEWIKFFWDI